VPSAVVVYDSGAWIFGTVNNFNGNIRKNMNISIQDIKDIPIMNPNIEDFASVKMRYRDLKNKD
jgi:hypothetical protein